MKKNTFLFLFFLPFLLLGQEAISLSESRVFVYDKYKPLKNKPIKVWYYTPKKVKTDSPVLLVMHGNSRKAEAYRDALIPTAIEYGFILIVPEFSKTYYPKIRDYHHGGIFNDSKILKEEQDWTFSIIEPLFNEIKSLWKNTSKGYLLYGFSAGAQFVHRYMYMNPQNRARKIVAASAGTYTMPDFEVNYSYGLKNILLPAHSLKHFYNKDYTVCVGTADTVLARTDLVKTKKANQQGRDRVKRAQKFFNLSRRKAKGLSVDFKWKYKEVIGVGHSQADIAQHIGALFF